MSAPPRVDTLARVETPEGVPLAFRLAGPWVRMRAYSLDLAIRLLLGLLAILVCGALAVVIPFSGLPLGFILIGLFLLEWGYPCLFEGLGNGKTPGKHLVHIRVIRTDGAPIGFLDAMLRNLLRAADALPCTVFFLPHYPVPVYGVGLLAMLLTPRFQRLGDLAAGTMVVREEIPALRTRLSSLKDVKPLPRAALAAGYRPPERTLDLIDRLYRRRRRLHASRAAEIAAPLASALKARLGYHEREDPHPGRPALFLLRVLRTFSTPDDAEAPGRARGRRGRRPAAPSSASRSDR